SSSSRSDRSRRISREPGGGIFFYAKHGYQDNTAPIANPHVVGAWIQFYWSEIESEEGRFDWRRLDARMKPWLDAGKKVALRIYWIGSGYWQDPAARRPTPQWVWDKGAKMVLHGPSGTEIPLPWDPIYRKCAFRFLQEIARKYDTNPDILFFDMTPGAETNPYRYVAFNQRTPEFREQYAAAVASNGRKYSDDLWLATVREWIDFADSTFHSLPLLVTLNVGSLNLDKPRDYSVEIGQYCVERGFYVGQNGLSGSSYLADSARKRAFAEWSKRSKVFFETLGDAGSQTAFGRKSLGALMEIMQAAQRGSASYLLPYPRDALKGTRGQPDYDPAYEEALAYGARVLGGISAPPVATVFTEPARKDTGSMSQMVDARFADSEATPTITNFQLSGERWTCEVNGRPLSGILIKPEGDGPFPAILISHGLGGNAEGFARPKAQEFVKWGFVCIATDYTHAGSAGREFAGKGARPPAGLGGGQGKAGREGPAPVGDRSQFGASPENVRRALACLAILRRQPYVDSKRVCAYGNSMGAFLTIGLAAQAPGQLAAAAITAGGVAPTEGFAAPTLETARHIRTPFLILHGSADTTVPPERSELLKQALDQNKAPNKRVVFDEIGHNAHRDRADDCYRLMREWFAEHGVLIPARP
ncbi:dienelactone hydrolase family protein, partial [Candidatus Sumerlaeota bacterium]|nr:dienelactone hydrolase family protein [Candidatus Sumerlaeota bacterium]